MAQESIKSDGYMPRIVDQQIERYLRIFGAVEISGTKWCGKTWSALMHAQSVSYVDQAKELAKSDPSIMLLGDKPHVVDEWQLVPPIWDAVRHEVDRTRGTRGAFILTGSSMPLKSAQDATEDENARPSHSGAGRIGRIRMYPMSLAESGESSQKISLQGLFDGKFEPCATNKDTLGLVNAACRGGWPEAIDLDTADAQVIAREYLNITFSESIPRLSLNGDIARRLLNSIARNLGQATTYKTIIADMYGEEENPAALADEAKVAAYIAALRGMYIVEEVPGWVPPARSRKRFSTKPKRYLADPSLAVAILGMSAEALLQDWQTFGLVFENLCIRDLSVYARSLDLLDNNAIRYYRDDSGLEADAIVQLADGRWAAFEFKVGEDKVAAGVSSLSRLRAKLLKNPKAQVKPPAFMAVITGNGGYAREVEGGIYSIPLRVLGK